MARLPDWIDAAPAPGFARGWGCQTGPVVLQAPTDVPRDLAEATRARIAAGAGVDEIPDFPDRLAIVHVGSFPALVGRAKAADAEGLRGMLEAVRHRASVCLRHVEGDVAQGGRDALFGDAAGTILYIGPEPRRVVAVLRPDDGAGWVFAPGRWG